MTCRQSQQSGSSTLLRPIIRLIRPIFEVFMGYYLPWMLHPVILFTVIYFFGPTNHLNIKKYEDKHLRTKSTYEQLLSGLNLCLFNCIVYLNLSPHFLH